MPRTAECTLRPFTDADMNPVLGIWLLASIQAHHFVPPSFWEQNLDPMRYTYIPASETWVAEENGTIRGFFCLYENTLAALFVDPQQQGRGIGKMLLHKAQQLRSGLALTVYKKNRRAVGFYERFGFAVHQQQQDPNTGHDELVMMWPSDMLPNEEETD